MQINGLMIYMIIKLKLYLNKELLLNIEYTVRTFI